MERPLLNTSSDRLNAIDSFSGALFGNSYKIIPLDESQELGDDVFPFNPSEYHIIIKKKMFETFYLLRKSRKYKEDAIRKKFKSRFHKYLRKIINTKLKEADSKYVLESFPQKFIADITRKTNYEVMNLTYERLFDYTYNQLITNHHAGNVIVERRNRVAMKKYIKNKIVLEYLSYNKKISEESGWERIKNMKYIDLLKAYLNSSEFQKCIEELSKKETKNYIDAFIYFASIYIYFFLSYEGSENNNHIDNNPQFNSGEEENNNTSDLSILISTLFPLSFLN